MCGRFVLTSDLNTVQLTFNLTDVPGSWGPRFNIAPSQPIAVITNENPKALTFHKWGLVPSWAKDISMGNKMINARSEISRRETHVSRGFQTPPLPDPGGWLL